MTVSPHSYTGKAWAVVDSTRNEPVHICDCEETKAAAERLMRLRRRAAFPLYPDAKWKVMRARIITEL